MAFKMTGPWLKSALKHANRFGEYHTTRRFKGGGSGPGKASDELGYVSHTHKSKTDGTIASSYQPADNRTDAEIREENKKKK